MTADEERQGAEMFAAGRSERDVAEALGCSPSTAHRLRERLQSAGAVTGNQAGETTVSTEDGQQDGTADDSLRDVVETALRGELLAALAEQREQMAANLADLEARAAASGGAIAALDAERRLLLADGKDAAQLRPRVASAKDDLADWQTSAEIVRQQIALVDQRIVEVQAEQQLAELREQLAPAVAERDAAIRATGGRMAAAVLAVKTAAEEFTAALADEKAARDRVEQLAAEVASLAGSLGEQGPDLPAEPESTVLSVGWAGHGGGELELARAMNAARQGRAELVAKHLAEAFGWLPPTKAEQAAEMEQWRQRNAEMDRQMHQPSPAPEPWTRQDTASVGVDQNGREVRYSPGYRPPRPPHPHDAYWGGAPYTG